MVVIVLMTEMVLTECSESPFSHWVSARPRIRKDGF